MTSPFVNLPFSEASDVNETFADSVGQMVYDGGNLRVAFYVGRFDEPRGKQTQPSGKRYPVCRLVLNGDGIAELMNRLNQMSDVLRQAGHIKIDQTITKPPGPAN